MNAGSCVQTAIVEPYCTQDFGAARIILVLDTNPQSRELAATMLAHVTRSRSDRNAKLRPMPHYRVYILDDHGRLVGAVNFDSADDEEAMERVKQLNAADTELWRHIPLVRDNSREPAWQ
jgi:hypothetical protein